MKFASNASYSSRRSPVAGSRGIVSTSQPLATLAGIQVLDRGGTAADAAVAVAACLQVTQPCSTGLGGDCFCLYYDAGSRKVHALNGSGRSPRALTLELIRSRGYDSGVPDFHALTVTVPGAAAAWQEVHNRFGVLSRPEIMAAAIRLAENGFAVSPLTSAWWNAGVERQLRRTTHGSELLFDGAGPGPAQFVRLPTLARSLKLFAADGAEPFYRGEVAEAVVRAVRAAGGVMDSADLASHYSEWVEAISVDYRGQRVWECPPNGQGVAALSALNILGSLDPAILHNDPLRWHYLIEAMRLGFADAGEVVADPDTYEDPEIVHRYLSKEYGASRASKINRDRAAQDVVFGVPGAGSDTVYFAVVDENGNGCSFINSNYMGFGTGIVPEGYGFSLQNRGKGFRVPPTDVSGALPRNVLAPGRRPYHTIIPGMITDPSSGALLTVFGVMGGMMQPQGHLQVVNLLVDRDVDPQSALDYPRFQILDGDPNGGVLVEDSIDGEIKEELVSRGHRIQTVSGEQRPLFGVGQIITRGDRADDRMGPQGAVFVAGSDPRGDGCAIARI